MSTLWQVSGHCWDCLRVHNMSKRQRSPTEPLFKMMPQPIFWGIRRLISVHVSLTQPRFQVTKKSWRLAFCHFYARLPTATLARWQDGITCQAITLQNSCGYICCEINSSRLLFSFKSQFKLLTHVHVLLAYGISKQLNFHHTSQ